MNAKNSIVTFALVGLAAGTAAWLLLGTKEGKRQLDRASDGIRQLTKSIRKNTKEGLFKASKFAEKANKEIDDLRTEAKSRSKSAINKANRLAKEGVNKVDSAIKTAQRKTEKI